MVPGLPTGDPETDRWPPIRGKTLRAYRGQRDPFSGPSDRVNRLYLFVLYPVYAKTRKLSLSMIWNVSETTSLIRCVNPLYTQTPFPTRAPW